MRILVAMSGGVDSSVVAHLLAAQGHELVGVRFTLWNDPLAPAISKILPKKCCNPQTIYRANAVAKALGIPLHIIDLAEDFKREVVDPFLRDYGEGLTPNPCIGCNRTIKFGRLLDFADAQKCDMVATGHYAQVESDDGIVTLREAKDPGKDQSYFLYGLSQQQLRRVMFPLGSLFKQDVMRHARELGIPLPEEYDESQDVCFYPEKEPRAFLRRHISGRIHPGEIRTQDGEVLGVHEGLPLYTVGQRRGLGIGGLKVPLHVVQKNVKENALIVASKRAAVESIITAEHASWIGEIPPEGTDVPLEARVSSQGKRRPGLLRRRLGGSFEFRFEQPIAVTAPGQSIVLYRDNVLLGGGVVVEKG